MIETKGDHLDNTDSTMKAKLGKAWETMAGHAKYRYYMVFDDKDVGQRGMFRLSDFLSIMRVL